MLYNIPTSQKLRKIKKYTLDGQTWQLEASDQPVAQLAAAGRPVLVHCIQLWTGGYEYYEQGKGIYFYNLLFKVKQISSFIYINSLTYLKSLKIL